MAAWTSSGRRQWTAAVGATPVCFAQIAIAAA
jgi:hypothetical protein